MSQAKKQIWYASSMKPYSEDEPWLYDAKNIDWAVNIEAHWPEYKQEVFDFIKAKDSKFINSPFYGDIDVKRGWSSLSFLFWGLKLSSDFYKQCPKLAGFIKKIPGVVSVSMSRLAPQSLLAEHSGDTNAIMRCHLGVEVPAGLPGCGFKVNNEEMGWQEGKFLIFNDAYRHSAWNNTDKRRIVIIIDVVRPEFLSKKNLICSFILTRHVSYLYDGIKFIRNMPSFIKTVLFGSILGVLYVGRPLYNIFK
jgi:aspartyl/asparaginyl beta-hydroxylase (cupin superfamily)